MGKEKKKTPKAVKKFSIKGIVYRVVRTTKKIGLKGIETSGLQLQRIGRITGGKRGWLNVGGGFKTSMPHMKNYITNLRRARH